MNAASPAEPFDPRSFATTAARWQALRARDPQADGHFLYSVATTGVYCHPSCAARPARPENVAFHATRADAERAGFRPCKRCRPDLAPKPVREAEMVAQACRLIEMAEETPALDDLAAQVGLSRFHFHRLFRRITGVTPKAYADAERARRAQSGLTREASVTRAIHEAGFNSAGRFYAAADAMLGMTPTTYRSGGPGEAILYAIAPCDLGLVLVAQAARGLCAILLGDTADALEADLHARFPRAAITISADLGCVLAQVIAHLAHPQDSLALPLDIRGTAFQRRVWEALRTIPAGQTRTYSDIAAEIGKPAAVRAVASAIAANKLAVALPCHRVVAKDGGLAGYRWGLARKQALLARERG